MRSSTGLRELGHASHAEASSEELAKTMHDVRGGPLSGLLGRLQLFDHLPHNEAQLTMLFVLVRDHFKIMRSARPMASNSLPERQLNDFRQPGQSLE